MEQKVIKEMRPVQVRPLQTELSNKELVAMKIQESLQEHYAEKSINFYWNLKK